MLGRIGNIIGVLHTLAQAIANLDEFLFTCFPSDDYVAAKKWVENAHADEFRKCKKRQQNKFQHLMGNTSTSNTNMDGILTVEEQDEIKKGSTY